MTLFGQVESPRGRETGPYGNPPVNKLVKAGAIGVGVVVALFVFFNYIAALTRIGAGYTGVEILLSGSQRGPSEIPIRTGWVFYSPLRSQIIEFPTYVQTVKWTRDPNEGHAINEEMSFNSKEGMEIYSDVSLSYAIDPQKVPDFYLKYRVSDLESFTHGILRDIVRNSLNEVASTYTIEQIYGEQKAEFLHKVQALIQERVAPVGVGIQQFGFIGAPRVPDVIAGHHRQGAGHPARRAGAQRAGRDPGAGGQADRRGRRPGQVRGYSGARRSRGQPHPPDLDHAAAAGASSVGKSAGADRQMERPAAHGGNQRR